MAVTEIKGGMCQTTATGAPKIGGLDWPGDVSVLKTFHGARETKNDRTVSESISASFDPRNLTCMGCPDPHHILNPGKPIIMIFSDQNFVPFLSGGDGNCIAIMRSENATLNEITELAIEVLEKYTLPHGTTLLIGSASHLFKVGTSQYATDWIHLTNRCAQKWPGVNICPLAPIVRASSPGSLVRDLSTLASWLGRVYSNSTTGVLDTWTYLLQIADAACSESTCPDICKILLPASISIGSVQPHTFMYHSMCPATLNGMNRKATFHMLKTLISTPNQDFSASIDAEKILTGIWANEAGDSVDNDELEMDTTVVLIGASNMKKIVPLLFASGYTVTDLTRSSWKATPENVTNIEEHLVSLNLAPGYTIVMELFGNSTFRYEQFDGTMALPFKGSHGYHMEGRIGVCEDDSLVRLLHNMDSLINIGNPEIKIFVPPLPRYLFTGCCALKNHSVNVKDPDHSEKLLASTLKFRNVIKNELLKKAHSLSLKVLT
jgi:hypothetical protein